MGAGRVVSLEAELQAARRQAFVGRDAELALWRDTLDADEPSLAVLWIVGPGGVGKSTLLHRYVDLAQEGGRLTVVVDARAFVGNQLSFTETVASRLGVSADELPNALAREPRPVVFVDTAEDLGALEDWLRETWLPSLPAGTLLVVAGRRRPSVAWRADGAWSRLLRVVALRNLGREESRALLARRGVELAGQSSLVAETHGHPLTLALIADVIAQDPDAASIDLRSHPDVVAALLARFVHDAPDAAHRRALEVAAHTRVTHEGVLRHALAVDDARPLFTWLTSLSFAVTHPEGLYLHDLAAHAIDAELRRADPERYVQMHRRLRAPIIERVRASTGAEQYRAAMDLSWLHRFSAIMGPVVDWDGARSLVPAAVEPADVEEAVAATRRFEGDAAAERIDHWIRARPECFTMVRASPSKTLGYVASVVVDGDAAAAFETHRDPRLQAVVEEIRKIRPLRSDDRIELCTWLGYDTHMDPSALVSQLSVANIRSWFGSPAITWGAMAFSERLDAWGPMMGYLDHRPFANVTLGSSTYAMFIHDWRAVPPIAFLDMMAEREISSDMDGNALPRPRELQALAQDDFAAQVKQALKDFADDDALRANPLSGCRVAHDLGSSPLPLRHAIELAAESLTRSGKDELAHAAVKLTYLDPARTQEEAAELLELAFSTYRRHLANGVARMTRWLWERDLYGYGPAGVE